MLAWGSTANVSAKGQIGRSLGPLIFCSLYWWAGRETAYAAGAAGMVAVCALVFGGLKVPPGTEVKGKTRPKTKAL
jgi:Na+/proline symporter